MTFRADLRSVRWLKSGVCVAVFVFVAVRSGAANPVDDYFELEDRMVEAQAEYQNALKSADPAQRDKIPDPRGRILEQIDKLADDHLDTPAGSTMAIGSFTLSWNFDLDLPHLNNRFKRIVEHYAGAPELNDLLTTVPDAALQTNGLVAWMANLRSLIEKAKEKDIKVNALLALGQIRLGADQSVGAIGDFENALTLKPEGELKEAVEGWIHEAKHLQIGMKAPDFEAKTLDGTTVSLRSFRGKVVLLNYWASWCAPCMGEVHHLHDAVKRLKDQPFEILGVSLDDAAEDARSAIRIRDIPGLQTWDEQGWENKLRRLYNIQHVPKWYLIDAEGVIQAKDPFGEKLIPAVESILKSGHPNASP